MDENVVLEVDDDGKLVTRKPRLTNYKLRSELSQEFLSRQPGFLENWGLLIFAGLLLILFGSAWFVHYPDIITTRVTLTAENAPKEIIIKQEGRLTKLLARNNQWLKQGDAIGWIESTANAEEVLVMSDQIDSCLVLLESSNPNEVSSIMQKQHYNLGELQQGYQKIATSLQQYNDYTINSFYKRRIDFLKADIKSLDKLNNNLFDQKKLIVKDVDLAKETFEMYKRLSDEKVITQEEYRLEMSKYMNREKAVPQLDASVFNNEIQKREKLKELGQLEHDMGQQKNIFQQALRSFKSEVDEWKKRYIVQAPAKGRLSFTSSLQENKYLRAGNIIGYINPDNSKYYAETILSQNNLGKLDTGMKVQLRFDAYPYQEWGVVEGKMSFISSVPSDSGFLATVKLVNGLSTNDKKVLGYKNGLKAQALIITKDVRLLDRFYFSLVKFTSVDK